MSWFILLSMFLFLYLSVFLFLYLSSSISSFFSVSGVFGLFSLSILFGFGIPFLLGVTHSLYCSSSASFGSLSLLFVFCSSPAATISSVPLYICSYSASNCLPIFLIGILNNFLCGVFHVLFVFFSSSAAIMSFIPLCICSSTASNYLPIFLLGFMKFVPVSWRLVLSIFTLGMGVSLLGGSNVPLLILGVKVPLLILGI